MEIITHAKNIAAVLATGSTIAYVSGYLVLRSRAHALGTDPAFTLVDEAYVFAGVRFLVITLIVLLILSPLIFAVRLGLLWLLRYIPTGLINFAQWGILGVVALISLMTFKMFSVNGLLLQQRLNIPDSVFKEAVLGGQPAIGLVLTFSIVLLTTLSVLWLKARLAISNDSFAWVLGLVVFIQIFMLPIYHGALFADRKVRVLAASPESVKGITGPLGIVDHTNGHYTVLGRDKDGNLRLATIKLDDLNGVPIKKIVSLNTFIKNDLISSDHKNVKRAHDSGTNNEKKKSITSQQANGGKAMDSNNSDFGKNFFAALVDYLQVTFEAIGSLGDSVVDSGQLWLVEIDASGTPSESYRIGSFNNLAWPVVGPDGSTIYALQQGQVVKLGKDGQSTELINSESRWVKLLGVERNGSILGFVYDEGETKPAILAKNGDMLVNRLPLSDEDQTRTSRLLQEARSYIGDRALIVERSKRGGRGFDVVMKSGGKSFNLSDCGDDRCGQASLSSDFRLALFIRQPRY